MGHVHILYIESVLCTEYACVHVLGECNNSGLGIKESIWVWSKMAVTLHPLGVEVIGGKACRAMRERTRRGHRKRERDSSPAVA